jgi:hypothetical protein
MRKCLGIAVLLAAFGCGDDTTMMSNPVQDLSVKIVHDLSTTGNEHCLAVLTCTQGCSGMTSCLSDCLSMGTPVAQKKWEMLANCALRICTATPDGGGTPACSGDADMSQGCFNCELDTVQGPSCTTQLAACVND